MEGIRGGQQNYNNNKHTTIFFAGSAPKIVVFGLWLLLLYDFLNITFRRQQTYNNNLFLGR
jgi:hypothetical protein